MIKIDVDKRKWEKIKEEHSEWYSDNILPNIKNAYEFIRYISQKAKVVLPIMNINIEDIIRDVVEKIDKKIIYPKYISDKERRYSIIQEDNKETNIA